MKEQKLTQAPKNNEKEVEKAGLTKTPPQFKLTAGAADKAGKSPTAEVELDAPVASAVPEERVSNFAKMSKELIAAGSEKRSAALMVILEGLKHDQAEITEFEAYFLSKNKVSLSAFVNSSLGEEKGALLLDSLKRNAAEYTLDGMAMQVNAAINARNDIQVMNLLMTYSEPKEIMAAYAKGFPGQSLEADARAIPDQEPEFASFLDHFFVKTQNYERVIVSGKAEATEARAIIARIYDVYGVDVNSQAMLEIARNYYSAAPDELKQKLKTEAWRLKDLKDLEFSLSKFATVSGGNLANSTRSGHTQSVSTVGRINNHIAPVKGNEKTYEINGASGAFFPPNDAIAIFDSAKSPYHRSGKQEVVKGPNNTTKKVDVDDGMRMVMCHELGHGFLEYAEKDFIKEMKFWGGTEEGLGTKEVQGLWESGGPVTITRTRKPVEAPPTHYAATGYKEDLAESVTMYLNNIGRMRQGNDFYKALAPSYQYIDVIGAPCPERMAFIKKKMDAWKKVQPAPATK
jgi:hypothetical protein